jgi:aryl-alcohol dehydrogenase-like predicted oxidoreductase
MASPRLPGITRSAFLRLAAGAGFGLALSTSSLRAEVASVVQTDARPPMRTRLIPSTGKPLGVVGCGTWRTFDVGSKPSDRAPLAEVLRILFDAGGSMIDTSPMYAPAETVIGDVLPAAGGRQRAFLATKVWTNGREAGIEQMQRSLALMHTGQIDLMQVHNLVDWRAHLPTLRAWKLEGRIGYLGVTHYLASANEELEAILRNEAIDFLQISYALNDRAVEARVLPLAADRGVAVIVNQPFGGGGLLREMSRKPLPEWAAEIDAQSWPQLLLKFVLGHPAVTCVIPGTGRPEYMRDNVRAGFGALPDAALRARMAATLNV